MNNYKSTYENEVASVEISGRRLLPLRNGKRQHVVEIDVFDAEGECISQLTLVGSIDGDKIEIEVGSVWDLEWSTSSCDNCGY